MNVSILQFLSGPGDAASRVAAYRAARREEARQRRARFGAFGIPDSVACPASVLLHHESRYGPETTLPMTPEEGAALARVPDYKRYDGAPLVSLPAYEDTGAPLGQTIAARRTVRSYSEQPVPLAGLSRMLQLGSGVTGEEDGVTRRAAPSAGALYPVETYVMAFAVDGLAPALYHYAPLIHSLEYVKPLSGWLDIRNVLDTGCQDVTPGVAFILTARFARVQAKYGERGYRFALLESGHIAQNLLLLAGAAGLASLPAGGFFDDLLNLTLGIDGETEAATYAILAGVPATESSTH